MMRGPSTFGLTFSLSKNVFQNLLLMWACQPSGGVRTDTKMMDDIRQIFEHRFDKDTLMLRIPQVFKHLKSVDVNFEMVTSNTLQQTGIEYKKNIVTTSKAVIFVNNEVNKLRNKTFSEKK